MARRARGMYAGPNRRLAAVGRKRVEGSRQKADREKAERAAARRKAAHREGAPPPPTRTLRS